MASTQRYFRPGQYLFREGEPSKSIFVITKGTVSVRKRKNALYVELARVYSNEVLGELSFFDRGPRSAGAIALTEVEALEITFESLDKIYEGIPDYVKTIVAALAERLRRANDMIRKLQKETVSEEIAGPGAADDGPTATEALAQAEALLNGDGGVEGAEGATDGEEAAAGSTDPIEAELQAQIDAMAKGEDPGKS